MQFVFAGYGVRTPTFSVLKRGNVSDLEKVVPHLMAAAARKVRTWKGTREYDTQLSKVHHDFAEETNSIPDHHSTSESKDSQVCL